MSGADRGVARWLLVDGNRHLIAALTLLGIFLVLAALGFAGVLRLEDHEAVRSIAGGLIPGLFAFLSIVLAINQLVLSQEFGSAGEIRERVESVREYRRDAEELAHVGPSPVLPTRFLSFVVRTIEGEAAALAESVGTDADPEARREVERFARAVAAEAGRAGDSLDSVRPGRIRALLPVLEYDNERQLYEARRIEYRHAEALSAETRAALSRLTDSLELFSVARSQFRTTYTQRVLARLSRLLLYTGVPALVVAIVLGLLGTAGTVAYTGPVRILLVSALFTLALSPLAVLSSYLLRVATVSERTIAVGPFVSRPREARADRLDESPDAPGETVESGSESRSDPGDE